jgi:hypothetical protein
MAGFKGAGVIMAKKPTKAVAKPALLTAKQIEKACPAAIEDLGKRIAVQRDKAIDYENKATHNKNKAEQHWTSVGQLLVEAKKACDAGGFAAFRQRFCPDLGKSRAHELLRIASGSRTVEETKTATRERVRKHRAAKKKDASEGAPAAAAVSVTGPVTDEDPAVSAEKRKAEYAEPPAAASEASAPAAEPADSAELDDPLMFIESDGYAKATPWFASKLKPIFEGSIQNDEAASALALAQFKRAAARLLPQMTAKDLEMVANLGQVVWDQKIAVDDAKDDAKRAADNAKRVAWEAKHPEKAKDKAREQAQAEAMESDMEEAKAEAKEDGERWGDRKDDWIVEWLADNWDGSAAEAEFEKDFAEKWAREHGGDTTNDRVQTNNSK